MSRYTEYALATRTNVVKVETLEISHPNFSKTYKLVRNVATGVTTTDAGTFDCFPLVITGLGAQDHLDAGFKIEMGDLGEVLPHELDLIVAARGMATKPTLTYRAYRSDDLSGPILGPVVFEIESFAFARQGATFEAKPPAANTSRTGAIYTTARFPMLRSVQ